MKQLAMQNQSSTIKDLRGWIALLEQEGELRRIRAEVHWNREIGAITRKVCGQEGPALLFENITDYQEGPFTRLFTNGLGSRARVALVLRLSKDTPYQVITKTFKERFAQPIKPIVVRDAPVKQNILQGEKVNLLQIPVPQWSHLDGGRYINTTGAVVTRDPETGFLNVGIYRGMIVSPNAISVLLLSSQHWGIHFAKYRALGRPMPVAVAYGYDPTLVITAGTPLPYGVHSEYDYAGGLKGEPLELVRCETSDLLVPASAEIVVEGRISPDPEVSGMEGPFGEYTGYFGGRRSPKPLLQVDCLTHRNNPIFQGTMEGNTPGRMSESIRWACASWAAVLWNYIEAAGVPGVLDVWGSPGVFLTNLRVKIRKLYRGHAKQLACAIWGCSVANWVAKHVTVVDEDIDIHNDEQVEWALAYRVNAGMGDIVLFPGMPGSPLDPSVPAEDQDIRKYGTGKWCRVLIDATKNWELGRREEYGRDFYPPLSTDIAPEDEELIQRRWKEYGL